MKFKCIFLLSIFVSIVILLPQTSFAQVDTSPLNATPLPVGSGARALGQGGAFIAVADDATAASWNPGGLSQLERSEFSVVGSFLSTQQDFDSGRTVYSPGNESVSSGGLNFASVAYPLSVFGRDLVAALNYQQVYDFHSHLDYKQTTRRKERVEFESEGGVGALTPAISMRIIPKLSIGLAINFYTDEFFGNYAWKQSYRSTGKQDSKPTASNWDTTFKNFQALNVTMGLLWNIWEKEEYRLTIGAVYDTPYTAEVDRIINFTSFKSNEHAYLNERRNFEVDYPMSFGAGLSFRYSDALCFSMDMTWTDWSEYMQKDEEGKKTRPLGRNTPDDRDIDDTYTVRLGTEYLLGAKDTECLIFGQKTIIPIRGGIFYDPRPSLDNPTDVYGISLGSGITFERLSFDVAYQFRWANDVDGEDLGLNNTNFDLNEHMVFSSIIVYF